MSKLITLESELDKYRKCYELERYGLKDLGENTPRPKQLQHIEPGSEYLDVSCGRGHVLKWVKDHIPYVTLRGTVFGEPGVDFADCQYAALPALEGVASADYVSCYEVIEHLPVQQVLPALERLLQITRKRLFFSANDRRASGADALGLNLHLSRFPLRFWLNLLDAWGKKYDILPELEQVRQPKKHSWQMGFDKSKPYVEGWAPIDIKWDGYTDTKAEFWFWYCPEFPLSEIPTKPSRPEELAKPEVKALWADLDARGMKSPIILHNIPGQPHRRYWTREGNHRRHWAEAKGLKTVPAVVYGGCEFEPCTPLTLDAVNRHHIKDGRLTWDGPQGPRLTEVQDWHSEPYTWPE